MNNKRKNGFTLIELIVVIAILAVLGMLLVPQISGYIDASQSATCANNRKLIERSIALSEANDVDPTTLTTLDAIKAANGSIYKGGEVCPKNGKISINNRKVTCELHKDDGSGGGTPGFIYTGTIMDQSKDAIKTDDKKEYNKVYEVLAPDGKTILYFKCLNPSGCSISPPKDHLANNTNGTSTTGWKEIVLEYTDYNNYEKGDIIKDKEGNYYRYTKDYIALNPGYIRLEPSNPKSGFEKVIDSGNGNWVPAN